MTIIVTGAGGFVGRELVRRLLEAGRAVVGLDNSSAGILAGARPVVGDIANPDVRSQALSDGCSALVHLATVPGGAAEADPSASRRVNIDAMYDLLEEVAAAGEKPRVVYASSIAVFGDPLPSDGVDDGTPIAPKMIYGGHKAMMEIALSMMSNRALIDGVTLRLPGILARPKGPSGMKSAFMSDLFHALRGGERFVCPVSEGATIWAESVEQCARNLFHALAVETELLPSTRAVTLPALRITMGELAQEIASQTGRDVNDVSYCPDPSLEAAFGSHPKLTTDAANRAGFKHDGSVKELVRRALSRIAADEKLS